MATNAQNFFIQDLRGIAGDTFCNRAGRETFVGVTRNWYGRLVAQFRDGSTATFQELARKTSQLLETDFETLSSWGEDGHLRLRFEGDGVLEEHIEGVKRLDVMCTSLHGNYEGFEQEEIQTTVQKICRFVLSFFGIDTSDAADKDALNRLVDQSTFHARYRGLISSEFTFELLENIDLWIDEQGEAFRDLFLTHLNGLRMDIEQEGFEVYSWDDIRELLQNGERIDEGNPHQAHIIYGDRQLYALDVVRALYLTQIELWKFEEPDRADHLPKRLIEAPLPESYHERVERLRQAG